MSEFQVNEAYDRLNLPRGSTISTVKERYAKLCARLDVGSERRLAVDQSYEVITAVEQAKIQAADSHRSKFKSKSERDLDGELEKLASKKPKLDHPISDIALKPSTVDAVGIKSAEVKGAETSDALLFDKVRAALLDHSKYLRTVKLLESMLDSPLVQKYPSEFTSIIFLAVTCGPEIPYCLDCKAHRDILASFAAKVTAQDLGFNAEETERFADLTVHRLELFSDDSFTFNSALKRLHAQFENPKETTLGTLLLLKNKEVIFNNARLTEARKVTTAAFKNREKFKSGAETVSSIQRDIHKP